jgi:hypothetical protein
MARLKRDDVVRYVTDDIADVELRRRIERAIDDDTQVAAWYREVQQAMKMLAHLKEREEPLYDPAWDALTPAALSQLEAMFPRPTSPAAPEGQPDVPASRFRHPATAFALDPALHTGGAEKVHRAWFAPAGTDKMFPGSLLPVGHWLELWHDEAAVQLGVRVPIDDPAAPVYITLRGAMLTVRVSGEPYVVAIVVLQEGRDPSILTLRRDDAPFTPPPAVKQRPRSLYGNGLIDKPLEDLLCCGFCVAIRRLGGQ